MHRVSDCVEAHREIFARRRRTGRPTGYHCAVAVGVATPQVHSRATLFHRDLDVREVILSTGEIPQVVMKSSTLRRMSCGWVAKMPPASTMHNNITSAAGVGNGTGNGNT